MNINSANLINFIKDYFSSIGISNYEIDRFFAENTFSDAIIIKLPEVCIVSKNRSTDSRTHQTHIHITGPSRYFFVNKSEADAVVPNTTDRKTAVYVSLANIYSLAKKTSKININSLDIKSSFTNIKIARRHSQENQIQISKIRMDDPLFISLRKTLFENDYLAFIKYKDPNNLSYLSIGIPSSFMSIRKYDESITIILEVEYNHVDSSVTTKLTDLKNAYMVNEKVNSTIDIDNVIYQSQVYESIPTHTDNIPTPKHNQSISSSKIYRRNPAIGKEAIMDNLYKCSNNPNHETFEGNSGLPYLEAHHLIPISHENDFQYSLDVKGNIIPLCSNCHAQIHYGSDIDRSQMIHKIYDKKKNELSLCGIPIKIDKLLSYYNLK